MTKRILLFFSFCICLDSLACTTFFINKDGQMVFGRNYDWITGNGIVCTNQRGLAKTSSKTSDGETISWISKYGSITFNQYGKEFPTGGMNEKGLVVELMWLDGTRYPAKDERPAVDVLQWVQFHLDNCASVSELIMQDKKIRIASIGSTPLHYLVADANGETAVIEFLDGKMKVHRGKDLPFPVLTNDSYDNSLAQTEKTIREAAYTNNSFTSNSIDRFAKACTMVKQFTDLKTAVSAVDYSFTILDEVAQGSHTKWSIVYDISNKKIYFKTLDHREVKQLGFSGFDFNCERISKSIDMNQHIAGDITKMFVDFTIAINSKLVTRSFDESRSEFTVGKETIEELIRYPAGMSCAKVTR